MKKQMRYLIQNENNFYYRFIVALEVEELLQIKLFKDCPWSFFVTMAKYSSKMISQASKEERIHGLYYPQKWVGIQFLFLQIVRWILDKRAETDTAAKASSPLSWCHLMFQY